MSSTDDTCKLLSELIEIGALSAVPTTRALWEKVSLTLFDLGSKVNHRILADLVLDSSIGNDNYTQYPRDDVHAISMLELFKKLWKENNWEGLAMFDIPIDIQTKQVTYKSYPLNSGYIHLLESVEGISNGTTGLNSWGASHVLASWVLDNPDLIRDKNVLELGSGIGYTAVSILSADNKQPKSYIASDCHPHVLSVLHHNISLLGAQKKPSGLKEDITKFAEFIEESLSNEIIEPGSFVRWKPRSDIPLSSIADVRQIDWRDPPTNIPQTDIIIAADVVYSCALLPPLAALIRSVLCRNEGLEKAAYIACTRRTDETLTSFTRQLTKHQLEYKIIHQHTINREDSLLCYDESYLPVKIYKIWPK